MKEEERKKRGRREEEEGKAEVEMKDWSVALPKSRLGHLRHQPRESMLYKSSGHPSILFIPKAI
jgi:hypothetical protein